LVVNGIDCFEAGYCPPFLLLLRMPLALRAGARLVNSLRSLSTQRFSLFICEK